ncbi:MAG: hydroxymethylpyrimidine/phosphomethylpyrimidine kinase [bacterium]
MTQKIKQLVIVIGGSDPSGGAGIQADLFTLQRLQVPARSVVTAVTAQKEDRFLSYETVSVRNFEDQLKSVQKEAGSAVVKIGMLGDGRLFRPLVAWLERSKPAFVILDPVLKSSTGFPLLDREGIRRLPFLLSRVNLITPNLPEMEFLGASSIGNQDRMEEEAKKFLEIQPPSSRLEAILLKGGHLRGNPVDLLIAEGKTTFFAGKRVPGKGAHGTGCALASAIAGFLARGKTLKEAVKEGRKVVLDKLRHARRVR